MNSSLIVEALDEALISYGHRVRRLSATVHSELAPPSTRAWAQELRTRYVAKMMEWQELRSSLRVDADG